MNFLVPFSNFYGFLQLWQHVEQEASSSQREEQKE